MDGVCLLLNVSLVITGPIENPTHTVLDSTDDLHLVVIALARHDGHWHVSAWTMVRMGPFGGQISMTEGWY